MPLATLRILNVQLKNWRNLRVTVRLDNSTLEKVEAIARYLEDSSDIQLDYSKLIRMCINYYYNNKIKELEDVTEEDDS